MAPTGSPTETDDSTDDGDDDDEDSSRGTFIAIGAVGVAALVLMAYCLPSNFGEDNKEAKEVEEESGDDEDEGDVEEGKGDGAPNVFTVEDEEKGLSVKHHQIVIQPQPEPQPISA